MDTAALESTYQRILDVAESGTFSSGSGSAAGGEWGAEMVLAHLTVNDEFLIAAVRAVLAREPKPYDNRGAIDDEVLAAQGPLAVLIDRLQTSSRQLVDVASQLTDGLEDEAIPVHIEDGGQVMVDQAMPIGRLISVHAEVHLPSHLSQLEGLLA
jgi:hypothetical protein